MDSKIEFKKKEILNIIKENDLEALKKFCNENDVFSNKKNYFQDLLSIALAENTIPEIVEFIIKQSNRNLNYKCKIHSIYATPLYIAIGHNNFKVADILLQYKADINFGITIEVTYYSLMEWLLMYHQLNRRNLNYILSHGYIFRKPTIIFNYLLDRKENKMLEMILRHLRFNHDTILRILTFHGKPVSNKQFLDMLSMNNNKYDITEEMYATAIEKNNITALKLLFEYENNTESKILQRIIKYDLLNKFIPLNHYNLIRNILVRYSWNYRCVNYRSIFYYVLDHFCNKNNFCENESEREGESIIKLLINRFIENSSDHRVMNQYDVSFANLIVNMAIALDKPVVIDYIIHCENYQMVENSINIKDYNGEYPILTAFNYHRISIFKYLLDHGADPNIKNRGGVSILSQALRNDDIPIIETLLCYPSIDINSRDINGNSPLSIAIKYNKEKYVEKLIQYAYKSNILLNMDSFQSRIKKGDRKISRKHEKFSFHEDDEDEDEINDDLNSEEEEEEEEEDFNSDEDDFNNNDNNNNNNNRNSNLRVMTNLNSNGNFLSDHLFSLSYGLPNNTKVNQSSFQVDRNALLFYAIRNNNFDIVYYLMNYAQKKNINMNIMDSHGTTPLHFAYKNNFVKILEYLLSVININQKDRNGNTLLHCTVEDNNIKWMTKLIHLGANVNSINYYGNSILDEAIAKGDFNLLMQLLKSNRLRIQGFNEKGYTPIISVLLSKKFNLKNKEIIITQFINKGTNLNIVGEDDKTPINYALKYKYANIISLLINNGANINVLEFKNNGNNNPSLLSCALQSANSEILQYFYEHHLDESTVKDITFTNLQDLIENNQLDIIKLVLDHNLNININMQNECNGNTLLHEAIRCQKPKIIEFLLMEGANPSIKNSESLNASEYHEWLHRHQKINSRQTQDNEWISVNQSQNLNRNQSQNQSQNQIRNRNRNLKNQNKNKNYSIRNGHHSIRSLLDLNEWRNSSSSSSSNSSSSSSSNNNNNNRDMERKEEDSNHHNNDDHHGNYINDNESNINENNSINSTGTTENSNNNIYEVIKDILKKF